MSINHSSTDFKQIIDMMMPDTALFEGKSDPSTNLYKWHVALALCLLEINDVVRLGWLDYFIDTASNDMLKLIANEVNIPDDIFEPTTDIEQLRRNLAVKSRIVNGIITVPDLIEIANLFGIDEIDIRYGSDGAYFDDWIFREDGGLPLYNEDDAPHAFIEIHLSSSLIPLEGRFPWQLPLTFNKDIAQNAKRFERLVQRTKSAYASVKFVYDL